MLPAVYAVYALCAGRPARSLHLRPRLGAAPGMHLQV